jgi:O-antigen/teichoic acid export membrane protein
MLRYSIPLMPSSLFWWITNLSDRFIILHYLSSSINGQYEAASRIPTMIVLVSNIFTEAWQMSAVIEKDSADQAA